MKNVARLKQPTAPEASEPSGLDADPLGQVRELLFGEQRREQQQLSQQQTQKLEERMAEFDALGTERLAASIEERNHQIETLGSTLQAAIAESAAAERERIAGLLRDVADALSAVGK